VIILPPPVTDITHDSEGRESEIENPCVHAFGGFFTQLLGCFRTNRTLCGHLITKQYSVKDKEKYQDTLFHAAILFAKIQKM
jgi:hypothetical protein